MSKIHKTLIPRDKIYCDFHVTQAPIRGGGAAFTSFFAWDDFLLGQKFYHLDDKVILSASTFAHALPKVKVNPPVPRVNNISFLQIISIHNQVRLLNENLWNDHHRKNTLMCYQIISPNSLRWCMVTSVENLYLDIYIFRLKGLRVGKAIHVQCMQWQLNSHRLSSDLFMSYSDAYQYWRWLCYVYWGLMNGTQMHYGRTVTANACFLSTWVFRPSPFKSQEQHTNSPYCSPYLSLKNY